MSLFFATPQYGGMCTTAFHESCLNTVIELTKLDFPFEWLSTKNESLITRARNTAVSTFMKTDFERFMFVDADIEFSPEDISKLWNLDVDVAVAAYPMKRKDAPLSAWRDNKLVEIKNETKPFNVDYAGTGFMMVKRSVFENMFKKYPSTKHFEGSIGECHALFDCEITGYGENRVYLSEDYTFCERFRKIGGEILLDPTIKLKHWGSYAY